MMVWGVRIDHKKSYEFAKSGAEDGWPESQVLLGDMYQFGILVNVNTKEAFEWYTRAAEQGSSNGQYALGLMHMGGIGAEQSYKESYLWMTLSSEQGHLQAQAFLREFRLTTPQYLLDDYESYVKDWKSTKR